MDVFHMLNTSRKKLLSTDSPFSTSFEISPSPRRPTEPKKLSHLHHGRRWLVLQNAEDPPSEHPESKTKDCIGSNYTTEYII